MAGPANSTTCHIVTIPFPGRGHINPMMNLCKLLSLRRPSHFIFTFIVTEEWLGFIGSDPKPANIRYATIPNVIPSELNRAADFTAFFKATMTKLEDPVRHLIEKLESTPSLVMYDFYLSWVLSMGNRMKIPVAAFFPMSATVFSLYHHYDLLVENGHVGDCHSEKAEEEIDYIPGVSPIRVADLVTSFNGNGKTVMPWVLESVSMVSKAQFLLFGSIYELEAQVIDVLKSNFSIPVYSIGPLIPYFNLDLNTKHNQDVVINFEPNTKNLQNVPKIHMTNLNNDADKFKLDLKNNEDDQNTPDYIKWLNHQPKASVLYISQGSFLSVSNAQLEEIIAGVHDSGVRYLWVARGEASSRFKQENDENGLVLPWCDQLRVLRHGSVGAFWSHCGWNSTKESAFSGVPMLTCPIFWDQVPNSKMIVEDWKIGKRVLKREGILVIREEISNLIRSFMDSESEEGKAMRRRAREIKEICRQAMIEKGSAQIDIDSFISNI